MGRALVLGIVPSGCIAACDLIPLNLFGATLICLSKIFATLSPNKRGALPTIPFAILVLPYKPELLIAAIPFTNSVSLITCSSIECSGLYIAPHSIKTVETILCPDSVSLSISGRR